MYDIIKKYEGYRSKAYWDKTGKVWTIGYGSTHRLDGSPVKKGDEVNRDLAEVMIDKHVVQEVLMKLPYGLVEHITPIQLEAIVSLCYNVGTDDFLQSKLYGAIMDNNYREIHKQWDWFKSGGKDLKGLYKRRTRELAMFMDEI